MQRKAVLEDMLRSLPPEVASQVEEIEREPLHKPPPPKPLLQRSRTQALSGGESMPTGAPSDITLQKRCASLEGQLDKWVGIAQLLASELAYREKRLWDWQMDNTNTKVILQKFKDRLKKGDGDGKGLGNPTSAWGKKFRGPLALNRGNEAVETTKAGESTPRQIPTSAAGIGMLIVEPDRHHQKVRAAAPQTRCCSPRAAAIVRHTPVELVIRSTRVIRCCPQSAPKRRPPPPPPPLTARRPFCAQALAETCSSIGYKVSTCDSGEDALALVSTHQVCNHRPTPTARCNHRPTRIARCDHRPTELPVVTTDLPELPPDTSPPTPLHRPHRPPPVTPHSSPSSPPPGRRLLLHLLSPSLTLSHPLSPSLTFSHLLSGRRLLLHLRLDLPVRAHPLRRRAPRHTGGGGAQPAACHPTNGGVDYYARE